jgi:TIR domain
MTSTVFLSHAGADNPKAIAIANELRAEGLQVSLDREQLRQGDSFVSFMEQALKESNYCLLLWSLAASKSKWVEVEWTAAFHRAVTESQNFLIVGRLENIKTPELLRPRLRVDLYPEVEPGVRELIIMWRADSEAGSESARAVVAPNIGVVGEIQGETVYITSQTFAKTFPLKVKMELPVAVILERVLSELSLPRQVDVQGKLGCRLKYDLLHEDQLLRVDKPLAAQGVKHNDLLWLQVEMQTFGATTPISGQFEKSTFRGSDEEGIVKAARQRLLARVKEIGLGF